MSIPIITPDGEKQQVLDIIDRYWGAHTRFLGEEDLNKLYNLYLEDVPLDDYISRVQGGLNFDYETSLKLIYELIKIIGILIPIYLQISDRNKKDNKNKEVTKSELIVETEKYLKFNNLNPNLINKFKKVVEDFVDSKY